MLGQCYANEKFNVIILAGGAGSRMSDEKITKSDCLLIIATYKD